LEYYSNPYQRRQNSIPDRILMFLKMRGAQAVSVLAKEFGMTHEGARLHLLKLMEQGLVESERVSKGVGRPTILYGLAAKGTDRFPDTHAELTVQLLASVRTVLGQEALNQLVEAREKATTARYAEALKDHHSIVEKLACLVRIRSEEGYMAEWVKDEEGFLFTENHCPICAAATECQGFCRAELQNFREVFGKGIQVERTEHIVGGARRCAYRITEEG